MSEPIEDRDPCEGGGYVFPPEAVGRVVQGVRQYDLMRSGETMSKQVQVQITLSLLTEIMTVGWNPCAGDYAISCVEGLPPGAELVRTFTNDRYATLVFEHESFADVRLGDELPILSIVYQHTLIEEPCHQ